MDKNIESLVNYWQSNAFDEATRSEVKSLLNNEKELVDAFYQNLEFGTGGLRGIMGAGTNRVNKYTIGMATQGLCNYLKKSFPNENIKVAIAHDSRNNSAFLAQITADVFSANGIKVYLFESMRPTPELSFTIRELKCHSGVVITASHNPKEYNGYKAYWNDGAQVVAPHDKNIINEVNNIKSIQDVKFNRNENLIENIGKEIDKKYLEKVKSLSLHSDIDKNISIVYSPLHGTGITLVPEILRMNGFNNINIIEEQALPDGNFPTVIYPNPEEKEAMTLALKKAEEINADLILATDPDADRVGIGVKNHQGKYVLLNGNETASLIFFYILNSYREKSLYRGNEFIVKTIVTSDILNEIAAYYNVNCYETLTGFKYISTLIREKEGQEKYLVGGEESYGYMISDFVRDKDAVSSCAVIAELCAYAKKKGISVFDMLVEIYQIFGFYKEDMLSITKKGMDGSKEIAQMMENFRKNPPKKLADSEVIKVMDYNQENTGFPKSNVLQFMTLDGTKVSVRPSGTEPKIKFYFSVNSPLESDDDFNKVETTLKTKIEKLKAEIASRN